MRADRMLRGGLLLALLAASAGCTTRDAPPQAVTHLSDLGADAPPGPEIPGETQSWRLRLTRL